MNKQETNNEESALSEEAAALATEDDASIEVRSNAEIDNAEEENDTEGEEEDGEGEDGEEDDDDDDDPFKMWMAILIAIVTLVAAWMGWVTAEVSGVAGDATGSGVDAVINAESTLTLNSIELYKHYRAYTDYARYQTTADLLGQEAIVQPDTVSPRKSDADDLAAVQLPFFLARYLTRDGAYNSRRELGEAWAETAQKMDLDPQPYFDEADYYALKTLRMMGLFVVLALSLLFYSLAECLHSSRTFWRYSMAILGTATLLFSVWGTVWVERWME